MNGKIKFHSPDGPAFQAGERWVSSSGTEVEIIRMSRWGTDKWDIDVVYYPVLERDADPYTKDAWNFQVRYTHLADLAVRI